MRLGRNPARTGLAVLLALALASPAAAAAGPEARAAIESATTAARHPWLRWPDFSDYAGHVRRFYELRGFAPAWLADGRATPQARALAAELAAADAKGLRADDYDGAHWPAWIARAEASATGEGDAALFDLALTISAMRFVSDLHIGRINPRRLGFGLDVDQKKYDLPLFVEELTHAADVAGALALAEPQYERYRSLQRALGEYRALAERRRDEPPLSAPRRSLEPGGVHPELARLARLLADLGDLAPEGAETPHAVYDAELVAAVSRFQQRHGLAADGVLGPATFRELQVPLERRVRQIELTLERWRWLPAEFREPALVVNIPEFVLRAFDRPDGALEPALSMEVIVGREFRGNRTPVFARHLRYLVFSPYWEVPPSIARKELVPKMARDPAYAARNDYVLAGPAGALPVDAASLELVRAGKARIRQKPGRKNALGGVKFVFPNEHNVYLHSTSSPQLFARPARAFSHGCIRVAKPEELAAFVLRGDPAWTRERIARAMEQSTPMRVDLAEPIWVFILYGTAVAEPDGQIRFFRDLYGHDDALDRALARGYPYPR